MAFDRDTRNKLSAFVHQCRRLLCGEYNQPGGKIARQLAHYGIQVSGEVADVKELPHLDESGRDTARLLREILEFKRANTEQTRIWRKYDPAVYDLLQEQAFTVLNRLCALRMAEAREILLPCVSEKTQSQGFQLYEFQSGKSDDPGTRYRHFLFSVFDELALDLPALFDRFSPQGLLFPSHACIETLLDAINAEDINELWAEDETIGWIYQYWNSQEERHAMRDASAAPRNSRELAVRNQFFTPRYVVEFLTDNTLGRIWYEMMQGQTRLKDECRYLVRRPDEVFLMEPEAGNDASIRLHEALTSANEDSFPAFSADSDQEIHRMVTLAHLVDGYARRNAADVTELEETLKAKVDTPDLQSITTQDLWDTLFLFCRADRQGGDGSVYPELWFVAACNEIRRRILESKQDGLSQEELLKQPVLIPFRPIKDPREIRLLDPACGSMHFGLYAFDLFERIYEEAWHLPNIGETLREEFRSSEEYRREIPRLIIENNIHGVDIDPRAAQIAGLSLWLRAQKTWEKTGLNPAERPQVKKSNVVCAEPMPGNEELLDDFCDTLQPPLLRDFVKEVFDKMKLAGEAGTLLKIEEEIRDTVERSRRLWQKLEDQPKELFEPEEMGQTTSQQELKLQTGLKPISADFFDTAEENIYAALRDYAEAAEAGDYQRRLFAEDAAHGFAFIDLCRKRYDAVVMNPPFGKWSARFKTQSRQAYPNSYSDILAAFVERGGDILNDSGRVGAITSRTCFFLSSFTRWRENVVLGSLRPELLVDLGHGVMDAAMVEAAAYVLSKPPTSTR